MELKVICREVDKDTGKIAVYPIEAEVTDTLIFKLGIRSRVNPELKYYAVTLCRWLQYGEEIKSILHSKNPTPKIRRYGALLKSKGGISMKTQEIIKALRRIAVNTGTLNCLGCGYEHSCGVHGCRMLREAADRLEQLQNNQRWYNPKDKLPESDGGVLAIVSGKPHPNITLVEAYCIAEYDVQDGWIVSDYPECTSLKIEAWMPLLYYQREREE